MQKTYFLGRTNVHALYTFAPRGAPERRVSRQERDPGGMGEGFALLYIILYASHAAPAEDSPEDQEAAQSRSLLYI